MTLIVALACTDGVVLGSDGQATTFSSGGPVKRSLSKIKKLGNNKLWAASGSVGMIQKILGALNSVPEEIAAAPLSESQLAQTILETVHKIRALELNRHRILYGQGRDKEADIADLLIVEYSQVSKIWHINPDCKDEFLEEFGYGCSGVGDIFAHTLLKNYKVKGYSTEEGALIAYRTIREAIDVGAFGLGEPIDIWIIDKDGIKQKVEKEMMGLRDSYAAWIEAETETFKRFFGSKDHQ